MQEPLPEPSRETTAVTPPRPVAVHEGELQGRLSTSGRSAQPVGDRAVSRGRPRQRRSRSPANLRRVLSDRVVGLVEEPLQFPANYLTAYLVHSFLTASRQLKELDFFKMNPYLQKLYWDAMMKEWRAWLHFSAVEILAFDRVPPGVPIIGTRWVLVDKNAGPRGEGQKTQIKPKARLVVLGHQEKAYIRSDAPTASHLAFTLICSLASTMQWRVKSADASNAYLQAEGMDRLLVLRPPHPAPAGLDGKLLRAKGSIYGTRDAPRAWWLHLKNLLLKEGWQEHPLEPALFQRHEGSTLTGLLMTHVDDLFFTGIGEDFNQSMSNLAHQVQLEYREPPFVFCGKQVQQDSDGTVWVDQCAAIEALSKIELEPGRKQSMKSPCTAEETSELRRVIGATAWLARQTRPDVLASTSLLAQKLGNPCVGDLVTANQTVMELQKSNEFKLCYRPLPPLSLLQLGEGDLKMKEPDASLREPESVYLFAASDAAYANDHEKLRSQAGWVLGIRFQEAFHPLDWQSMRIKRVCRSTLAAEANALVEAAESLEFVRMVIHHLLLRTSVAQLRHPDTLIPTCWHIDAKSLFDTLTKDTGGATADKRIRVVLAQLREIKEEQETHVVWVDGQLMLADILTKVSVSPEYLRDAFQKNEWNCRPTEATLARKLQLQQQRRARKTALKQATST